MKVTDNLHKYIITDTPPLHTFNTSLTIELTTMPPKPPKKPYNRAITLKQKMFYNIVSCK